jgi:tetratricopeptide (TPR) repeat protein
MSTDTERAIDLYNRGIELFTEGDLDKAREVFTLALELEPAAGEIAFQLGMVEMMSNRPMYAVNRFNRAIAMGHEDPDLHYNRACMAACAGMHREMLESLALAIEEDEANSAAFAADADLPSVLHMPEVRALLRLPPLLGT